MAVRETTADRGALTLLWIGVLAGPVAWFVELEASYALTDWVCRHGHPWLLHVTTVIAVGLAIAGIPAAARGRRIWNERLPASGRTGAFLGTAGLWLSLLFSMAILASVLPKLLLSPCVP
jgi:hypothetical protein